jgi:Fe-S cluster biogenesis protein NfuA
MRKKVISMATKAEVAKALDEVRPSLQADGGDVELVGFDNDIVKLRLVGHCAGCAYSQMTLKMGIERFLKQKIPSIKGVESV